MSATRLHFGGETLDQDGGGAADRTRYYVDRPRSSALTDPEVPKRGDAHPEIGGLIADAVTASDAPDGNAIVTVLYSNDGRFGTPDGSEDTLSEGAFSWSLEFRPFEQPIPVIKRVRRRLPAPGGGLADPIDIWVVDQIQVLERRAVNVLRSNAEFNLQSGVPSSLPQFTAIGDQADNIHTIGSRQYVFAPKGVDQRNPERWAIRYEWTQDKGTLLSLFEGFSANSSIASPNQGGPGGWVGNDQIRVPYFDEGGSVTDYVRPPFRFIQVIPDPENPQAVPIVRFPYAFNPDSPGGWTTLPGVL